MSEKKPPSDATPEAASGAEKKDPKDALKEATARVDLLRTELKGLESQVKIMKGQSLNRDPKKVAAVQKENEALKKDWETTVQALYVLLVDGVRPREESDFQLDVDGLKKRTVEYCQKIGIEEAIWKNIES